MSILYSFLITQTDNISFIDLLAPLLSSTSTCTLIKQITVPKANSSILTPHRVNNFTNHVIVF